MSDHEKEDDIIREADKCYHPNAEIKELLPTSALETTKHDLILHEEWSDMKENDKKRWKDLKTRGVYGSDEAECELSVRIYIPSCNVRP